MESRRYLDVIWVRIRSQVLQKGQRPGCGERDRNREWGAHRDCTKKAFPQSHWLEKWNGLIFMFSQVRPKDWSFKKCVVWPAWSPEHIAVLQERRAEDWKQTVLSEDPLGCTGGDSTLFLEHVRERWHCLSRDKRAGRCHYSTSLLNIVQRCLLRVASLGTGSWLVSTPNSMLPCFSDCPSGTNVYQSFLGETLFRRTSMALHYTGSLKFGVLNSVEVHLGHKRRLFTLLGRLSGQQ